MSNITNLSLSEILKSIKSKKISSLELTQAYIKNIENAKKLNAFVTTTFDQALENAKKFDNKPNNEQLLSGIPLAVKDLFCTENVKTTAGSNILNNFVPSYESTVTKNLWNNGAFLLGKLILSLDFILWELFIFFLLTLILPDLRDFSISPWGILPIVFRIHLSTRILLHVESTM